MLKSISPKNITQIKKSSSNSISKFHTRPPIKQQRSRQQQQKHLTPPSISTQNSRQGFNLKPLRLFHVGLTGRVMDTLKIAPPRKLLDPRELEIQSDASSAALLYYQPSHPAIFHGLFTFRRREEAHANGHVPCSFTKETLASIRGK